jgi:hypothetical protein
MPAAASRILANVGFKGCFGFLHEKVMLLSIQD